jgi:hypothetical protein
MERKIKLRKCKYCQADFDRWFTLNTTCSPRCNSKYLELRDKEKKERKIAKWIIIQEVQKNTKRAFSKEVKEEVMKRDKGCIICGDQNTIEFHHCLYWGEQEFTPDRNDANKLVWLCQSHHKMCHFDWIVNIRWFCKSYLWL